MDNDGIPGPLVFDLNKESPFSFKCQVCSACCFNKAIRLNPYEVLRLARNVGCTTTEFLRTSTEEGDFVLRNRPDGGCIFLASRGCGVYLDRPLVCRLFPLGQITDGEGRERYASMPLHPDCLGLFGADGTVGSYLESQDAKAFFHYDALYEAVTEKILKKLEERGHAAAAIRSPGESRLLGPGSLPRHGLLSAWLDIDRTVAAVHRTNRQNEPKDRDELVSLHLETIEEWLASF
jgi:Fe-S-cluster containining protein